MRAQAEPERSRADATPAAADDDEVDDIRTIRTRSTIIV